MKLDLLLTQILTFNKNVFKFELLLNFNILIEILKKIKKFNNLEN